jgi:rare lipoprotein A
MIQPNFVKAVRVAASLSLLIVLPTAAHSASKGCGHASWYALHSKTASGERMNPSKLTAAHRSLAFGTRLKVTNSHNGRAVIVRVNDRGPFIRGRVLDLSKAAAQNIGLINAGFGKVCYEIIG